MKKTVLIIVGITLSLIINAQNAIAPTIGDGTSGNPYQIATLDNLCWLSKVSTAWSKCFIQTADIDASSTSTWGASGFSPIGSNHDKFTGTYNGKGHIISGLYIKINNDDYIGFFGYIKGSTIDSLGLVSINYSTSTMAGGLVAYNEGTINSCYCTGTLTGTSNIGGLVGWNNMSSTITNSYSTVRVKGSSDCGGLIGVNAGIVRSCYSTDSVIGKGDIGGLIGKNINGTVINCHSSANIKGSAKNLGVAMGGLVGYNQYDVKQKNATIISNCYSTGNVTGSGNLGGLVGSNYGTTTITQSYCSGTVTATSSNAGGLVGINSNGVISQCISSSIVNSTSSTVGGLVGGSTGSTAKIDQCFNSTTVNATAVGCGYIGGLVGVNSSGSTITNCYNIGNVDGFSYVGGIAGFNSGTISQCYNKGTIKALYYYVGGITGSNEKGYIYKSYNTGDVVGLSQYTGGLVGYNNTSSKIDQCFNTGNVIGYFSYYVGGLAGHNYSSNITNSYNTGSVSSNSEYVGGVVGHCGFSDTISQCYNVGRVNATSSLYIGAFVGYNNIGIIAKSYWNSTTSNLSNSLGYDNKSQTVSGLTTSEMKQAANYSWALNSGEIWAIDEGKTYPVLDSLANNAPFAFADTINAMTTISLSQLLNNDYDYETGQTKLTYKVVSCTSHFGTVSGDVYSFDNYLNEGVADTIIYRVGEHIVGSDTLWGNQALSLLKYSTITSDVKQKAKSSYFIYSYLGNNQFMIKGLNEQTPIAVYDVSGSLLFTKKSATNESLITLPNHGVYIIKVANESLKVVY